MIKGKVNVSTTQDATKRIRRSLDDLGNVDVYVGVPEGNVGSHDGITNPQLLFLLTHGVRSAEMREAMNEYMGMTPDGTPIMRDFNTFLENTTNGMPYNAAYELFIHEHGSALWQIPPRPILEPSIEHSQNLIADQLKQVAVDGLDGHGVEAGLNKVGQLGVNVAKDWFTNPLNEWPPNAPSTVAQKGSERPNIDTANLRNSITYVVAKKT